MGKEQGDELDEFNLSGVVQLESYQMREEGLVDRKKLQNREHLRGQGV